MNADDVSELPIARLSFRGRHFVGEGRCGKLVLMSCSVELVRRSFVVEGGQLVTSHADQKAARDKLEILTVS